MVVEQHITIRYGLCWKGKIQNRTTKSIMFLYSLNLVLLFWFYCDRKIHEIRDEGLCLMHKSLSYGYKFMHGNMKSYSTIASYLFNIYCVRDYISSYYFDYYRLDKNSIVLYPQIIGTTIERLCVYSFIICTNYILHTITGKLRCTVCEC